ncbi:MAG: YceI family protein, partial [Bacteroidota bacterium]
IKISFLMLAVSMFVACKNTKGKDAEVSDKVEKVSEAEGKTFTVDAAASKVMWEGTNPTGGHNGTVDVSEGSVILNGSDVVGGSFVLDMNTIACLDIEDEGKRGYLESHLKGLGDDNADDFFNVKKYPSVKYEITKVTKKEGDAGSNALVYGNLTMKDVTKSVAFSAQIDVTDGMVKVTSPQFKIDRTEWGIKYGSPSFFEGLADKAINNDIGLKINLVAKS